MIDLGKLRDPFPPSDVEWRIGRAGENANGIWAMCLAYITNRAIMERLDTVCGPENWRNEYRDAPCGGVLCGLSVRVGDEWVTKWDGAENTDMEAVKGGLSGAMKRAAVQWGIGRYLYDLPEGWATVSADGRHHGKTKEGKPFRWDPPSLPDWALPAGSGKPPATHVDRSTGEVRDDPPRSTHPTTGGEMIDCPNCGGECWDNRQGKTNPRSPDLKCKNKECGHAIWLSSWRDELLKDLGDAHSSQVIDTPERERGEEAAKSLSPARMKALATWIDGKVREGVMGR